MVVKFYWLKLEYQQKTTDQFMVKVFLSTYDNIKYRSELLI